MTKFLQLTFEDSFSPLLISVEEYIAEHEFSKAIESKIFRFDGQRLLCKNAQKKSSEIAKQIAIMTLEQYLQIPICFNDEWVEIDNIHKYFRAILAHKADLSFIPNDKTQLIVYISLLDHISIESLDKITSEIYSESKAKDLNININIILLPSYVAEDNYVEAHIDVIKRNFELLQKIVSKHPERIHSFFIQNKNEITTPIDLTHPYLTKLVGDFLFSLSVGCDRLIPANADGRVGVLNTKSLSVDKFAIINSQLVHWLHKNLSSFFNKRIKDRESVVNIKKLAADFMDFVHDSLPNPRTDSEDYSTKLNEWTKLVKERLQSIILDNRLNSDEAKELFSYLRPIFNQDVDTVIALDDGKIRLIDDFYAKYLSSSILNENPFYDVKCILTRIHHDIDAIEKQKKLVEELKRNYSPNDDSNGKWIDDTTFKIGENSFKIYGKSDLIGDVSDSIESYPINPDILSKHSKADLHSYFSKIKSQGEQGACASFSLVSIAEYYLNNFGNKDLDLSEAFLYYNARKINGKCNEDSGVSLGDVVKAMQSEGICVEELCPYNYKVYDQEPSEQAYKDGEKRKAVGAARVQIDPEHIKSAILEGFPVVGCFRVFNSLEHNTSGYVHMPTEEELLEKEMYHAMVICGFNDKSSYFIVRNSWGEDFGDKGYCYLPYAYIRDNTLTCDAIIVKGITAEDSIPTPVYEKTRNKENDPNVKYIVSKNVLDEEIFRLDSIKEQLKKRLLECRDKLASLDFDDIIDKKRDIINSEIENLRQRKEAAILALNNEKFISYKKTNIICGISDILLIGGALYSRIKPGIDAAFPYLLSSSVLMTFCWPLLLLYKIRKNKKHLNNAIKSIDTSIENLNEELANFERFCLNLQCLLEALSNMDSFSNEKTWNLSSLDNLWSEIFNETIDLPDIDKSIVDGIDIPFKLSDFIQRLISEENNADGSNGLSTFKRLQAEILKHLLDNFNLKIEELYPEGSREWNEFIAESDSAKVLADIEYDETESTPIICTLCSNLGTPKLPFQSNHVEIHNNMYIFSIIKYVLPRHLILIN